MNALLAAQLPSSLPGFGLVLQGAAAGSLIAAAVLVRAWRRRVRVEPWEVTAAWSLLGAVTMMLVIAALVLTSGAQRSIPRDSRMRSGTASSSRPSCARSRATPWRSAGSRISSGSARRRSL